MLVLSVWLEVQDVVASVGWPRRAEALCVALLIVTGVLAYVLFFFLVLACLLFLDRPPGSGLSCLKFRKIDVGSWYWILLTVEDWEVGGAPHVTGSTSIL